MQADEVTPLLDFDSIDDWAPRLKAVLRPLVPDSAEQEILRASPRYIEDALDLLFELTNRASIIDTMINWLCSTRLAGYHGSRLTASEVALVHAVGLIPLEATQPRNRLERALSRHPRWPEVVGQLDTAIHDHGQGACAGRREGQVHLTLSRCGLVKGFPHYLMYGSEFDQHVAHSLLGPGGKEVLRFDGEPRVIQFAVPGDSALAAAHPFFGIRNLIARGDVPNLVREFLQSWSYRLAHPSFQSRTLEVDCGMFFRETLPSAWIVGTETLTI
jgi:hypothetical protein